MGANGRQNDGSIRPAKWRGNGTNTQQLHHRLGHINRTLHADIEKPTTLEKTFNNLHKINFYVFIEKKLNFVEKICIWLLARYTTNNTQHNKQYTTQNT